MLSVADPFEPLTPLQVNELGAQNGSLILVGAEPSGPDTRPGALLQFAAPTDSAAAVSADVVPFVGRTAFGFTSSPDPVSHLAEAALDGDVVASVPYDAQAIGYAAGVPTTIWL